MSPSIERPASPQRAFATAGLLIVAIGAALLFPSPESAAGPAAVPVAVVGYWTNTGIVVADADGQQLGTFTSLYNLSLNGHVIAVEREGRRSFQRHIVGKDIASGERLFKIRNAFLPVVSAGGAKVAFLPTAEREDSVMSVWMRSASGRIRKIVQFSPGSGFPGIRHGMRAGGGPLEFALDDGGRTMAVAFGLETIRVFDVWVIDVKTKGWTRITRSNRAHSPSLSPDGSGLALQVENSETCPDDVYGDFSIGKIHVMSMATGDRKTLTQSSCDVSYGSPRWIDNESIVTTRASRDETEEFGFDLDIVRVNAVTGEITELLTDGNPCCLVVSPSLGKIAYEYTDRSGFSMLDISSGAIVDFPEGSAPALSGQNRV